MEAIAFVVFLVGQVRRRVVAAVVQEEAVADNGGFGDEVQAVPVETERDDDDVLELEHVEHLLRDGTSYCNERNATEVVNYVYNTVVKTPKDLCKYPAFSSKTYGETMLNQMKLIVDQLAITADDVFVDLGSGVGQLVLFTAAYSRAKLVAGIELCDIPAKFADGMGKRFREIMAAEGKSHGEFELHHGSFFEEQYRELILSKATVLFINNFIFEPKMKLQLEKQLLKNLKPGTRIVTTEPLGFRMRRVTARNQNDMSSIIITTRMGTVDGNASWTGKTVKYYLGVVDYGKLENFRNAQAEAKKRKKRSNGKSTTGSSQPKKSKK